MSAAPADIERDLALLDLDDKPKPRDTSAESTRMKVQIFLRDLDIAPGGCVGVEVCSLYRCFKYWLLWVDRKATLPHPKSFARVVARLGFDQQFREHRRGVDRRLLGLRRDSAARVREWLSRHPDTPEERAVFHIPGQKLKRRKI